MNSVTNSRLLAKAGFERIFIQPAASDAGNALGAALWVLAPAARPSPGARR